MASEIFFRAASRDTPLFVQVKKTAKSRREISWSFSDRDFWGVESTSTSTRNRLTRSWDQNR